MEVQVRMNVGAGSSTDVRTKVSETITGDS